MISTIDAGTETPVNDIAYQRPKVLLVDDNGFARTVGQRVLRAAGIQEVQQASSGSAALDMLRQSGGAIDVVFCDLLMPDIDGIQLLRGVANLALKPAFVFLSGASTGLLSIAQDTARARGFRVLGIIEKPLTVSAVRHVLAHLDDKPWAVEDTTGPDQVTVEDLEKALAEDQFILHYQPKVSMANRNLEGFESLVRWKHPEKGLIPPTAFIGLSEQSGRIGVLTDRIAELALKQHAAWAATGLRTKLSINLSAYMLVDLDLPDRLAGMAEYYRIDPRQLILEVTESGLFRDTADTLDILARLHMRGFPLSIDDFGTGYSSMEQLRRVPFAEMKIDRAFVNGASSNAKVRAILESSAKLGRSLNMSVVAEGAETFEDWETVLAAGVDIVQGYFIARPMAQERVPEWLGTFDNGRGASGMMATASLEIRDSDDLVAHM